MSAAVDPGYVTATPVNPAGLPTAYEHGGRLTPEGSTVDPILVEIVQGTLASVEMEVETAIGRTSRSPMIRDAHDFRAGIHDRQLRKLTGRSYSALVHPVVRDFPLEEMSEGDVFFHNDVYESEGGIGHLPDLCVTVPVFHGGEVVAFVQAFGHHDDIGGGTPGSMPSGARSVFEEGLSVPPIKLWDKGVPNKSALRIMTRNSRMPDSLAADLDAECSACLMGARRLSELFERYGRDQVEASFDAILDATTETYRREILAKVPDGTYVWEDYAEHDGVDEPKLHTQRITLTKTSTGGPEERYVDALADAEPVKAGQVIRIRTTGGGGWGDPLERPVEEVERDLRWGKVSFEGAREDYGVVASGDKDEPVIDVEATEKLREELRSARTGEEPFFDRGPGYARLSGGAEAAECDWL